MTRKAFFALLWIFFGSLLHAGSVRMYNDSAYTLRAVVRGADGTYLGEVVIHPQQFNTWSDSYNHVGKFGQGNLYDENVTRSQTPYTILWYCMDGADFSVCTNIPTGSTVIAQTCDGAKLCHPKQQPGGPFPNQPEGQYLQPPPQMPYQPESKAP